NSETAPVRPKSTSSIVVGLSMPTLRTRPDSGTEECDHECVDMCHGPHAASVRALKQAAKLPAGTLASSAGRPSQLAGIAETTVWKVLFIMERSGPVKSVTWPFRSFIEAARMSTVDGSMRFGMASSSLVICRPEYCSVTDSSQKASPSCARTFWVMNDGSPL